MENALWSKPSIGEVFATTRWSVIALCKGTDDVLAQSALEELCHAYWQPVYVCIRRHGHCAHDAQDLTQEFFVRLLKGAWLEHLDEAKGRFRAYLSVSLNNFLRDRWRRCWTLRRGRSYEIVSFDATEAENLYSRVPVTDGTPEFLYERQWANAVIGNTLEQLRIELRADGKEILFEHFDSVLTAQTEGFCYAEVASSLGLTSGGLRAVLHRWRKRFQALVRDEIARTVLSKSEIDDELRHLQRVVARPG